MKQFTLKFLFFALLLQAVFTTMNAQSPTQTIRGTVTDKQSQTPLPGASVVLVNSQPLKGTVTDLEGSFRLEQVPVGRQELKITYVGYNENAVPNILVTSGKEVILSIELEESVVLAKEVVISAAKEKAGTVNQLATISARSFSMEEVNRFSGGRNDAARLASNFAGVSTADDSRNDIVIRGNSPTGVLWRLEGIPIPNPNHFSTLGTTGGPVSALNTNLLKNSDFLTSAFPAEYGNATAGVFDVGFRNGNNEKLEFTAQLNSFSGLELMAEGPLSNKKNNSFLISYRYSFIQMADLLGIPIGTNATPNYQDISFKLNFNTKKFGQISLFGIGGKSNIDFLGNELDENDLFANPNQDAYVTSNIGIAGLKHNYLFNNKTYLRTVIAVSSDGNTYDQDKILENGELQREVEVKDKNNRVAFSSYVNHKFNAKNMLRVGMLTQYFNLNLQNRDRTQTPDWITVRNFSGGLALSELYAQWQYRISNRWTLNSGVHTQLLTSNKTWAAEPRIALNWQVAPNQTINLGYGLHSQMQPLPVYFYETQLPDGTFERTNAKLNFTRSQHLVAGYEIKPATDWRAKTEIYYQHVGNVPVDKTESSFSVLNAGADFVFPEAGNLVNNGTGRNYGLELTVEKFYSKGYYALFTGSLFQSKYKGSDGIERNTAFNNRYTVNLLGGKEIKVGKTKSNAITFDGKLTAAGGRYYTPVDVTASQAAGTEILLENEAFSKRFSPYFRLDAKVGYRMNGKKGKVAQSIYFDFQNLTNHKNVFTKRYNELINEVNTVYQSGFFPDILYRIQF